MRRWVVINPRCLSNTLRADVRVEREPVSNTAAREPRIDGRAGARRTLLADADRAPAAAETHAHEAITAR